MTPPAPELAPVAATNPLADMLQGCVVRIEATDGFRGSGFWVAPGELLTCAHVVHGADAIAVRLEGQQLPASVTAKIPDLDRSDPEASFYPLPDVALLRVDSAPPGHPCVLLDDTEPATGPPADILRLAAFTLGEHAPGEVSRTSATVEYEGSFEEAGMRLLKLKGGQVIAGFSGCPALNTRTGAVCALIDTSRGEDSSLGGFGVPVAAFAGDLDGLLDRNRRHHASDGRWAAAVAAEAQAALERAGGRDSLPLLPPAAEFGWDLGEPPSDLLRPRRRVVQMVGRARLQDELMRWREAERHLGVVVVAGQGGYGKTRLAIEECRSAEAAGWTAGLLALGALDDLGDALDPLARWPGRLFVAIDYAETRPEIVASLILRLMRQRNRPPVRLVLVCRQRATRQDVVDLFARGEAREELSHVFHSAELVRLDHQDLDRSELFAEALSTFSRANRPDARPPRLRADHFARPLFLLAAALLKASDPDLDVDALPGDGLMLELLDRHEAGHWERWNAELEAGVGPEVQPTAVALAALMGADSAEDAVRVVRLLPDFHDATEERARAVARWLSRLYGSGRLDGTPTIMPLEPDPLAEALVARELVANEELLGTAMDAGSAPQLARMLLVLERASARSEALRNLARRHLDDRLGAVLEVSSRSEGEEAGLPAALGLALAALQPAAGAAQVVDSEATLPPDPHLRVVLAALAANFHGEQASYDDPDSIRRYVNALLGLSSVLGVVGRREEAVHPAEVAVSECRKLADAPGELGFATGHLAEALYTVGRGDDAVKAARESVDLLRKHAEAVGRPALPQLGEALNNLGADLLDIGEIDEAIPYLEEAAQLRRKLVRDDPEGHQRLLGSTLSNLGNALAQAGDRRRSLETIEEAAEMYKTLREKPTPRSDREFAIVLSNMAVLLYENGRGAEARAAAQESVDVLRRLVALNRRRFLEDLGGAVANLSNRVSDAGRVTEALALVKEAVEIYRELASWLPDRFRPELASSLNNLSVRLAAGGEFEEALAANRETLEILRELTEQNPARFKPEVAGALANMSNRLSELGRDFEALRAVEEAVELWRELVGQNSERHLPDLATSLNNLSNRLATLGKTDEALAAIREAVEHRTVLAERNPGRFGGDLATSLNNLSGRLLEEGHGDAALEVAERAVAHWRTMYEDNPPSVQAEYSIALNNLGLCLKEAGRISEAIEALRLAVELRRDLAIVSPGRFLPMLAKALKNFADQVTEAGRAAEALDLIEATLAAHEKLSEHCVLLPARAYWHALNGDVLAAVRDGRAALREAEAADYRYGRTEARLALRETRERDEAAFRAAWQDETGEELPVWLLDHTVPDELRRLLADWIVTETWNDSQEFFAANSDELASDLGEAGLEYLSDINPGSAMIAEHLTLLKAVRKEGVEQAYTTMHLARRHQMVWQALRSWAALGGTLGNSESFLVDNAEVLLTGEAERLLEAALAEGHDLALFLGILTLSRLDGPKAAFTSLADPFVATDDELLAPADSERLLARARLAAGNAPSDPAAQFSHALAAVGAGLEAEAAAAAARGVEQSATWERDSWQRRLVQLGEAHSGLQKALEVLRAQGAPAPGR